MNKALSIMLAVGIIGMAVSAFLVSFNDRIILFGRTFYLTEQAKRDSASKPVKDPVSVSPTP